MTYRKISRHILHKVIDVQIWRKAFEMRERIPE
jgi:hypothetical protein